MTVNARHNPNFATVAPIFGTIPAVFGGFKGFAVDGTVVNLANKLDCATNPVDVYAYILPVNDMTGLDTTQKPVFGLGGTGQEGIRTN